MSKKDVEPFVPRFNDIFNGVIQDYDMTRARFRDLQDIVKQNASEIYKALKEKIIDLCDSEREIVEHLSSCSGSDPRFCVIVNRFITEGMEDIKTHAYWVFLKKMLELRNVCRNHSDKV